MPAYKWAKGARAGLGRLLQAAFAPRSNTYVGDGFIPAYGWAKGAKPPFTSHSSLGWGDGFVPAYG